MTAELSAALRLADELAELADVEPFPPAHMAGLADRDGTGYLAGYLAGRRHGLNRGAHKVRELADAFADMLPVPDELDELPTADEYAAARRADLLDELPTAAEYAAARRADLLDELDVVAPFDDDDPVPFVVAAPPCSGCGRTADYAYAFGLPVCVDCATAAGFDLAPCWVIPGRRGAQIDTQAPMTPASWLPPSGVTPAKAPPARFFVELDRIVGELVELRNNNQEGNQ